MFRTIEFYEQIMTYPSMMVFRHPVSVEAEDDMVILISYNEKKLHG